MLTSYARALTQRSRCGFPQYNSPMASEMVAVILQTLKHGENEII